MNGHEALSPAEGLEESGRRFSYHCLVRAFVLHSCRLLCGQQAHHVLYTHRHARSEQCG